MMALFNRSRVDLDANTGLHILYISDDISGAIKLRQEKVVKPVNASTLSTLRTHWVLDMAQFRVTYGPFKTSPAILDMHSKQWVYTEKWNNVNIVWPQWLRDTGTKVSQEFMQNMADKGYRTAVKKHLEVAVKHDQ